MKTAFAALLRHTVIHLLKSICSSGFCGLPLQEHDLLGRLSDLKQEVSCRRNRIADLDHEIHSLNETISTLTKELELKGKEVLRVRSEANMHIRYQLINIF